MNAPRLTLLATALLAAALWRLEVEHHGWAGLTWLGYFHLAIPVGALLFALWLHHHTPRPARLALLATFALLTLIAYLTERIALDITYSRFPGPPLIFLTALTTTIAAFFAYPLTLWLTARALGVPLRPRALALALALYAAAFPLTTTLLDALAHPGADLLHAIKSGAVIPPLLYALGHPFTRLPTR